MPQQIQSRAIDAGVSLTLVCSGIVNMTGWPLVATLKDSSGTKLGSKGVGTGITIGDGPNGVGTVVSIDYTDGTSKNLTKGFYFIYIGRTDTGAEDLNGKIRLRVNDSGWLPV